MNDKIKTNGNMYDGTITYNPIGGECPHSCKYCAVKKMFTRKLPGIISKYSGELRLDKKALKKNLGKGNTWFLCGVGNDLFADGVIFEWVNRIIEHCNKYPENTYMLQTKNAANMYDFFSQYGKLPDNYMIGITLETDNDLLSLEYSGGNYPKRRAFWLSQIEHKRKYVTIEPIMKFDLDIMVAWIKEINPELVYIGFNSLRSVQLPEPTKEETIALITELSKFTTVKIKDNAKNILK